MRQDPIAWYASLLFTPDAQLRIRRAHSDLLCSQPGQLNINDNCVAAFAKIDGRRPRFRSQRLFSDSRLLQSSKQAAHPIAQALKLEPLEARGARCLDDSGTGFQQSSSSCSPGYVCAPGASTQS